MTKLKKTLSTLWRIARHFLPAWPSSKWGKRVAISSLAIVLVAVAGMYSISRWYVWTTDDKPQIVGASFVPSYASHFGLDPKDTLDAMLTDLDIKHLRLVSYWNETEPTPGTYNFDQLDWQFEKAEQANAKITLSIGVRQPRWPECHPPTFIDTTKSYDEWKQPLQNYLRAVIERYKNSPALQDYQVENEFFLKAFGECKNFDRQRLIDEVAWVKKHDSQHPIVITRSNNGLGIPLYAPKGDVYGVSVYKRVWDAGPTKRYLEYPQPAWYYAFMAGVQKIVQGRDMNVHEMQAEAWAPNGQQLKDLTLDEQNKSLNAERLAGRFDFGRATGLRQIDMWGAEYWYYRKVQLADDSLWQVAKQGYKN